MAKVLVIGSGGREHAIVWKLQKEGGHQIYCAPGNPGMRLTGDVELVDIDAKDIDGLVRYGLENWIDLTIPGPEDPLVNGIVNEFGARGLKIFGPNKAAARLEGSKVFAKEFMDRHDIPTASYAIFSEHIKAIKFVEDMKSPLVVKADGLCGGKGVIVCDTLQEQYDALDRIMIKKEFKGAGDRVVIEDKLVGTEVSYIVVVDGYNYVCMPTAKDYKAVYATPEDKARFEKLTRKKMTNPIGPNTGGMGSISPSPDITPGIEEIIKREIVEKTIKGAVQDGWVYKGVLYCGIMLTKQGPKLLEYNCRFGDPETEPQFMRLMEPNLSEILMASIEFRELREIKVKHSNDATACITATSGGYPISKHIQDEFPITYPPLNVLKDGSIFFAGVKEGKDKRLVTSGGRVLYSCAKASTMDAAIRQANILNGLVQFERKYTRTDIGR